MEIVRGRTEQDYVVAVAARLSRELQAGHTVLWLISGANQLSAVVAVMNLLRPIRLDQLVIMQTDERLGRSLQVAPVWLNLNHLGLMTAPATAIPMFRDGLDIAGLDDVVDSYEHLLQGYLADCDVIIGQLTLGANGSLAGIEPHSPAAAPTARLVTHYATDEMVYFTLAPQALAKLTVAYVHAFGVERQLAVASLAADKPVREEPAQILKRLAEVYIYN